MTDSFYQSQHLTKKVLHQLQKRSDALPLTRATILFTLLIISGYAAVIGWNINVVYLLLSQLIFGLVGCSMFACEHETVHNTAFKTKVLNQIVAFLAGIAHVYPSTLFRELHFTHHRYTHIPGKDPEISLGSNPGPSVISSLPMYLSWVSGLPLLLFKIGMIVFGALGMPEPIRLKLYPFINPKVRFKLVLESFLVLSVYAAFIILAVKINSGFWALLIGQVTAHCLLTCFVTAEHNGLPHEGTIMDKTRSTKTNPFVRWLMWNMPYHAEHHAYPAVPFYALPTLHKHLQNDLKHKQDGYPQFHLGVLQKFF